MPGKKLLVVDDDQVVLNSCKVVLEAEGFQVNLVSSAREAITFLEDRYMDLMIMDVKMPEKDGLYILDVIREKWPLDRWPELPVLVMSGYPTPDTINDLIKRGVREFISKPFTPDELIESVHKALLKKEKKEKK